MKKNYKNKSTSYLTHLIEGVSIATLGDNLIDTYIEKKGYNLHVRTHTAEEQLEGHSQLLKSYMLGDSVVYVMSIDSCWNKDYRLFRSGKCSSLSDSFIEHFKALSGYKCVFKKSNEGKYIYNVTAINILDEYRMLACKYLLKKVEELYDSPLDCPFVSSESPIRTWKQFNRLCDEEIRKDNPTYSFMIGVIPDEYELIVIDESEFIENLISKHTNKKEEELI
jgi:hypothetical protein